MQLAKLKMLAIPVAAALFLSACGGSDGGSTLTGEVRIDGSSTVYPISEAVAEEFRFEHPNVKATIGVSGTGGGFNKFVRGEIDINNASRPVKPGEAEELAARDIGYVELRVAYDGLAVVVNKENDWITSITTDELKKIWEPGAQGNITRWNQINPEWPDQQLNLYGPGIASGTYDYFTEAVVGQSGMSRGDYTASEDDNVLVQGIAGDRNGLGFFGLAYYEENADKLKLVGVDGGDGVVLPSAETVKNGTYKPLSRPVFIYVTDDAAQREEVRTFVRFYLETAAELVPDVGYIPLQDEEYQAELKEFEAFVSDSLSTEQ